MKRQQKRHGSRLRDFARGIDGVQAEFVACGISGTSRQPNPLRAGDPRVNANASRLVPARWNIQIHAKVKERNDPGFLDGSHLVRVGQSGPDERKRPAEHHAEH